MSNRKGRGEEFEMVPEATFTSYYGKPVVKAAPWGKDIPSYLFLAGLAGGSSLLAAGADLGKHGILRRNTRITAIAAIGASYIALVHDLGRPSRFINMLRVAKPTSPMSVGTWILTLYGPAAGLAAAYEFRDLVPSKSVSLALRLLGRPAGFGAALLGSLVASYTAVLLGDTATPTWHQGFKELPFVFVGSAACASSGMAMITSPISQAAAARRLATGGAVIELIAMRKMEASIGVVSETLNLGRAGQLIKVSRILTIAGATGSLLFARKSRTASVASGAALALGSVCARFGIFEAGQNSAKDPKYTVVPQRERILKGRQHG